MPHYTPFSSINCLRNTFTLKILKSISALQPIKIKDLSYSFNNEDFKMIVTDFMSTFSDYCQLLMCASCKQLHVNNDLGNNGMHINK